MSNQLSKDDLDDNDGVCRRDDMYKLRSITIVTVSEVGGEADLCSASSASQLDLAWILSFRRRRFSIALSIFMASQNSAHMSAKSNCFLVPIQRLRSVFPEHRNIIQLYTVLSPPLITVLTYDECIHR